MFKTTTITGTLQNHNFLMTRLHQMLSTKDFSARIIFPTLSLLKSVQDLWLCQSKQDGIGGIQFLLLEGFIQEVEEHFGLPTCNPPAIISELMIRDVFTELKSAGKLDYLGRVPFSKSYRRAILDGISEWQRSYLLPDTFQKWAAGKEPKLQQLAMIYRAYSALLSQKGYHSDAFTIQKLNQIAGNKISETRSKVILYGFTDLTPIQARLIDLLRHWFDFEVMVDPTLVPEFQHFVARQFMISFEFEKIATSFSNNVLKVLQTNFWAGKPVPQPLTDNDQSLQIIQAAGWNKQAVGLAREISYLRQNSEYLLEDFLILSPQPQNFIKIATPVFREYQLSLPKETLTLKDSPLMNGFIHCLKVIIEDWKWPEMEVFIRHCYTGSDSLEGDRLLLELGERYGALSGRERWLRTCRDDAFKQYFHECELNIVPFEKGVCFLESIPGQAEIKSYLYIARDWFITAFIKLSSLTYQHKDDDLYQFGLHLQGIQQIIQTLDEVICYYHQADSVQSEISLIQFLEFLTDYILPIDLKTVADKSKPEIRVTVPQEARGLQAKVVFITGLEQGSFPRYYINDWKLSPSERTELQKFGVELETGEGYQIQEKFAFYWSLQAAQERLYLVYQEQDSSGQPLNPSSFLDEIWQWFPDLRKRVQKYGLAPEPPACFRDCYCEYETKIRFAAYLTNQIGTLAKEEAAVCLDFLQWPFYRELATQIGRKKEFQTKSADSPLDHQASKQLLARLYGEDYTFAITALEDYLNCPYRFFLKHFLKVRPLRRPQLLPDQLELGNLYHQVFQDFYDNFRGEILTPAKEEEYRQSIMAAFANFYREWEDGAANDLVRLMLGLQEGQIQATLNRWLLAELKWVEISAARFQPRLLEFGFGLIRGDFDPASIPKPYQIDSNGTRLKIWGKVDRVDTDSAGNFVVYDYKLGRGPNTKDLLAVNRLQIPVYLMALEELYYGKGKGVGGCYLGLKEPSRVYGGVWHQERIRGALSGKGLLDDSGWQSWLDEVRNTLVNTVQGIRNGEFFPTTIEKCLTYCEYKSCCQGPEREVE